ncbi:MAG: hypothetical protein LUE17_06350 [Planctomycetaceae bacterium]|nr:hypothetical protein [Planctomycetaceae bacterium]
MTSSRNLTADQLRLVTKVARLYHQRGLKQPAIARRLEISQAGVSRALRDAEKLGIVRTTVHIPEGVFADLEAELEDAYGLGGAVVVEPEGDGDTDLFRAIGDGAAAFIEHIAPKCEVIGISSWSESLFYTVKAMRPPPKGATRSIIQVLGGIGVSVSNSVATRLTERLAQVTGADPVFLLVPGICSDEEARRVMMNDLSCRYVFEFFDKLSLLLLGIGTLEPSRYLSDSGNRMTAEEQAHLRSLGAVGDVCQRFYDSVGKPVPTPFENRVIGIGFEQMLRVPRRVGVAGGMRKFEAIRGALRGGILTALVTDAEVARRLVAEP